jgi:hypothetical protein
MERLSEAWDREADACRLCLAVVHPLNAVGHFTARDVDAPFVVEGDYFLAFKQ